MPEEEEMGRIGDGRWEMGDGRNYDGQILRPDHTFQQYFFMSSLILELRVLLNP